MVEYFHSLEVINPALLLITCADPSVALSSVQIPASTMQDLYCFVVQMFQFSLDWYSLQVPLHLGQNPVLPVRFLPIMVHSSTSFGCP
jgi:hypothetical protein